jgi:hypothetical protein
MCNPAIALAVISAATTAVSVVSEVKAANRQNKAIAEQYAAQTEEIRSQEGAAINDRLRAARKEQGRVRVAAGEAGLQLTGSVASLLQDSTMQTALYDERVRANAGARIDAATAEANSMYSQVQKPTILGAGLRVAGSAIKGYVGGAVLGAKAGSLLKLSRAGSAAGASGFSDLPRLG